MTLTGLCWLFMDTTLTLRLPSPPSCLSAHQRALNRTFRLCFGRMVQMRRHDDAGQIMEEIALGFFHTRHFLQSAELQPLQIDFVASGFVTPLTTRCMDGDCLEQAFEGGAMYNATEGSRYSATVRFFCDNALDVLASKLEMALPDPPHFDFTVRSPLVCPFVMDASDAA
eukprot:m.166913 g.166913  ORF g.166913 m.166913 type:complete len:170 (-) comp10342_c0_seq3:128-637(-)